jgi:hypothetical protein
MPSSRVHTLLNSGGAGAALVRQGFYRRRIRTVGATHAYNRGARYGDGEYYRHTD